LKTSPRPEQGYGIVETALVVIAVALLIAVVVNHYGGNISSIRQTALKSELATLRNTISLFSAVKGRCPDTLGELVTAEFALPYTEGPIIGAKRGEEQAIVIERKRLFRAEYLKAYALDEENNILDSFGLPYRYDPADCSVRSRTPGYEHL
jgi:general secretion pathway protein G